MVSKAVRELGAKGNRGDKGAKGDQGEKGAVTLVGEIIGIINYRASSWTIFRNKASSLITTVTHGSA